MGRSDDSARGAVSQRQGLPPCLSQPRSLQPHWQPPRGAHLKGGNKAHAELGPSRRPAVPRQARRAHLASGCRRQCPRGSRPGPGSTGSSSSTGSGSACPRRAPGPPAAQGTRAPPARRGPGTPPWPGGCAPGSARLRSAPRRRRSRPSPRAPRPSPCRPRLSLRPPQVKAESPPPRGGPAPPRPHGPRGFPRPRRPPTLRIPFPCPRSGTRTHSPTHLQVQAPATQTRAQADPRVQFAHRARVAYTQARALTGAQSGDHFSEGGERRHAEATPRRRKSWG